MRDPKKRRHHDDGGGVRRVGTMASKGSRVRGESRRLRILRARRTERGRTVNTLHAAPLFRLPTRDRAEVPDRLAPSCSSPGSASCRPLQLVTSAVAGGSAAAFLSTAGVTLAQPKEDDRSSPPTAAAGFACESPTVSGCGQQSGPRQSPTVLQPPLAAGNREAKAKRHAARRPGGDARTGRTTGTADTDGIEANTGRVHHAPRRQE